MSSKQMHAKRILLLVVPALALAACGSADRAGTIGDGSGGVTTVAFNFVPVSWGENSVDLDPPGPSVGDRLEYTVPFLLDGKPGAELTGVLLTTGLGKGTGAAEVKEERTITQTYRLNDSDSITVEGVAKVKPGQEAKAGAPLARTVADVIRLIKNCCRNDGGGVLAKTVVGGTGAYLNAKGTLRSDRNDDGSFTYTFTLRLP